MLKKTLNLLFAHQAWIYLTATATAAFVWGFIEGLLALGLIWMVLATTRYVLLSNNTLHKVYEEISDKFRRQAKHSVSTNVIDTDENSTYAYTSPLNTEPPNPATWSKKKMDEYLYDPAYKDMPGNIWHSRNPGAD